MKIRDCIETCKGHTYLRLPPDSDNTALIINWMIYGTYIWEFFRKDALPSTGLFGSVPVSKKHYLNVLEECSVENELPCYILFAIKAPYTKVPALYLNLEFPKESYYDLIKLGDRHGDYTDADAVSNFVFKCIMYSEWAFAEYTGDSKSENATIEVSVDAYRLACARERRAADVFKYYDQIASVVLSRKICSFEDLEPYISEEHYNYLSTSIKIDNNMSVPFGTNINMEANIEAVKEDYTYFSGHYFMPTDGVEDLKDADDAALALFKRNWFMSIILSQMADKHFSDLPYGIVLGATQKKSFMMPVCDVIETLAESINDPEREMLSKMIIKTPNGEGRKHKNIIFEGDTIKIADGEIKYDSVECPEHYVGKYECWDVMQANFTEAMMKGFAMGNVFKYIWRFREKNGVEDLKKARWYLDKAIELYSEKEVPEDD